MRATRLGEQGGCVKIELMCLIVNAGFSDLLGI